MPLFRFSVIILFFVAHLIHAQELPEKDTVHQLNEVIIIYQADKLTPVTFQNIYAPELKAKSIGQEPSFLLSETPSITVYSDAGSGQGYSYIRMRGIDQTRINITLDGVPLNEPEDQGAYFSNFPDILNSVSKIQIQRGIGTSKNGVASYGGSVQLFSPNLYDSARITLGAGYGSFNSMRLFAEYNSGIKNKQGLYVRASQIYSDGYKYQSSNNSQSVFVSKGFFYDKTTWKLNVLAGHQQNQMAWLGVSDSLIAIDRRTNANQNEKDRFGQSLVQLQNMWQTSASSSLQSSLYYIFAKGNYDFNLNNFLSLPDNGELINYALQSDLIGFYSNYALTHKNLNWRTGVHGNFYKRTHIGSDNVNGFLYENYGVKKEGSIFTKADYNLNNLNFFADIQYRFASFDYKGNVPLAPMNWHFINPLAGVSLEVKRNMTLYYSLGRTGREPTRNDMFSGNDDLLEEEEGSPLLGVSTPEYVVDHELGFRHQSGKASYDFNLYYMSFSNEIVLNGNFGPNGLALTNKVERSFRSGVELAVNYQLSPRFTFIQNSSLNYSRIKEQQEVFSPILTPSVILFQELIYTRRNLSLALSGRYQGYSFIDFANTTRLDPYFLVNTRAQYQLKRFDLSVFLNNLTNTRYFNNGYVDFDGTNKYFVQAPLNMHVAIKYSF